VIQFGSFGSLTCRNFAITSSPTARRSGGIYGEPYGPSIAKEADRITAHYRAFIEAAPFFVSPPLALMASICSPRGDAPGFVRIHDEKTLLVPDRRGNNRIDSCATFCTTRGLRSFSSFQAAVRPSASTAAQAISTDPALAPKLPRRRQEPARRARRFRR